MAILKIYSRLLGSILKKTHEIVFVVNFRKLGYIPEFDESFKLIGKWYVTTTDEWVCHSDYDFNEFRKLFLRIVKIQDSEKTLVNFSTDYYPYGLVM